MNEIIQQLASEKPKKYNVNKPYKIRPVSISKDGTKVFGITIPELIAQHYPDVSFKIEYSKSGLWLGSVDPSQNIRFVDNRFL